MSKRSGCKTGEIKIDGKCKSSTLFFNDHSMLIIEKAIEQDNIVLHHLAKESNITDSSLHYRFTLLEKEGILKSKPSIMNNRLVRAYSLNVDKKEMTQVLRYYKNALKAFSKLKN